MPFEAGQIVLVYFPFTDRTSTKLRPALIVSSVSFNRGADVVAVAMSSRVQNEAFAYPIVSTAPYFPQTGLRYDSSVKWTKLMTISASVISRPLGTIPAEVLAEIRLLIRGVFS